MKSTKKVWFFAIASLMVATLGLQSCDDTENLNPDGSVPADFNYLTTKSVNIQVQVNDQFNGNYLYKVEVFDQNPLTSDTVVNLLSAGTSNKDKAYTTRVVVPQYVRTLYVQQTSPDKKKVVKAVSVEQVTTQPVICNFKPEVASASKAQKTAPVHTEKASDYPKPASGLQVITSTANPLMGLKYLVPAGTTLTNLNLGWTQNTELFVEGNLIFDKQIDDPDGLKIILLPGSNVTFTANNISIHGNRIVVAVYEGAILEFDNQSGTFGGGAILVNDGLVTVKDILAMNGASYIVNNNRLTTKNVNITNDNVISNYGSFIVNESVNLTAQAKLVNNGELEAGNINSTNTSVQIYNNGVLKASSLTSAATIFNTCRIETEDFKTQGATIHNGDGALIISQDMYLHNTTLNLTGGSVIEVKDLGYNNVDVVTNSGVEFANNVVINGSAVGGVQPLFSGWTIVDRKSNNKLTLNGTFEFCVLDGEMPSDKFLKSVSSGVNMTTEPTTVIESSACNLGGVNSTPPGGGGTPPEDPAFPIVVVEGTDYIYSMEDLWPHMGDYDMNDFVFKIHAITKYVNSGNNVEKMTFQLTPLASGSTKMVSAALQLDGVNAGNVSVNSTEDMARIEDGQEKSNLILFENVHALFGLTGHLIVNTFNNATKVATSTYTFEITFTTPVAQTEISVDKLNFYSIVGTVDSDDRHEIHLAGYAPSNKVRRSPTSYKDENNMVWALMLPTSSYKYPAENVKIFDAYPNFMNWAKSGGKEFTDWFLNPSDNVIHLYTK